jgi:hypothetical protein
MDYASACDVHLSEIGLQTHTRSGAPGTVLTVTSAVETNPKLSIWVLDHVGMLISVTSPLIKSPATQPWIWIYDLDIRQHWAISGKSCRTWLAGHSRQGADSGHRWAARGASHKRGKSPILRPQSKAKFDPEDALPAEPGCHETRLRYCADRKGGRR